MSGTESSIGPPELSGEIPRRRNVLVTVAELLPHRAVKADLPKTWAYG